MTKSALYIPVAFIALSGLFAINCGNKTDTNNNVEEVRQKENKIHMDDSVAKAVIGKNYLLGHFKPEKDSNFVQAEVKYAGSGIWLRRPVWEAFKKNGG